MTDNTAVVLDYEDKDFASHGNVTTGAAWKFTAEQSGTYRVSAAIGVSMTSWTIGEIAILSIYKGGVQYSILQAVEAFVTTTAATLDNYSGSDLVHLNAGEYIDIRFYQNTGASPTISANPVYNYIAIEKI
jgi:hypothetical protein